MRGPEGSLCAMESVAHGGPEVALGGREEGGPGGECVIQPQGTGFAVLSIKEVMDSCRECPWPPREADRDVSQRVSIEARKTISKVGPQRLLPHPHGLAEHRP